MTVGSLPLTATVLRKKIVQELDLSSGSPRAQEADESEVAALLTRLQGKVGVSGREGCRKK